MEVTGAEASLRSLAADYAEACDRRDSERFVSLFLPDGVLLTRWPDPGRTPDVLTGHDELGAVPRILRRWASTVHAIFRVELRDLAGDWASGDVRCAAHHFRHTPDGIVDTVMDITYHDTYAHVDDGWRFARREIEIASTLDAPFGRPPRFGPKA